MTTASESSPFVTAIAPRLESELGRLVDEGFVQAFSPPRWTHRYSIAFVIRYKQEHPATVQAIRFDDYLIVTAAGDRSFSGPLDLGPVDAAMREAGWGVEHKSINRRKEYRAEIPWVERDRAAVLMARTLELLGATDPGAVEVRTYVDG